MEFREFFRIYKNTVSYAPTECACVCVCVTGSHVNSPGNPVFTYIVEKAPIKPVPSSAASNLLFPFDSLSVCTHICSCAPAGN